MNGLAIILVVSAAGYALSRWTRLPVIPLLLVAGLLLSLFGLIPQEGFRMNAFELGLAFLVFTAGIELNPNRFKNQLAAVLWVGSIQFVVVALCGFLLARALGFNLTTCIYLGIALSTSSTLVVVSHLKQQHQMFEPFGRLVIGVLLFQDMLMILILVVLARLGGGGWAVAHGLGGVVGLTGLALITQRWILPFILNRLKLDEETLLLTFIGALFSFLGLAHYLDLPPAAGAFLAGFSLASFPVNGVARGLLQSLSDFFQAIFFTTLGSLIILPDPLMVAQALLLALVVLLLTPPLVTMVAERTGLNSRAALESGLLLAQTSELALVLGLTGSRQLDQISPEIFSAISLITVLTMTLTPFLARDNIAAWLMHFHPTRRRPEEEVRHKGHILMLGFGAGGMWVVKPLLAQGHEVLVVDDDPIVIDQLQRAKIPCLRGDGSDPKVLARAGAAQAKLILASMRRVTEAERVLQFVKSKQVPVLVRVFESFHADHIRQRGGIPVLNSLAALDTFMEWFEKTIPQGKAGTQSNPANAGH